MRVILDAFFVLIVVIFMVMACIANSMYLWVLLPAMGLAVTVSLIKKHEK